MYIRVTSRCNMTCAHCAFSCTAQGSHMSKRVFLAALQIAAEYSQTITLGGGEPTLHPRFWEYIGLALSKCDEDYGLFLVTNGKITQTALALAGLAKRGVFGVALSQDEYHDPIDPRVVKAFTRRPVSSSWVSHSNESSDFREIRSSERLIAAGRALENQLEIRSSRSCFCDDIIVEPDGALWACGCRTVSFGTVFRPLIASKYWEDDTRCFGRV